MIHGNTLKSLGFEYHAKTKSHEYHPLLEVDEIYLEDMYTKKINNDTVLFSVKSGEEKHKLYIHFLTEDKVVELSKDEFVDKAFESHLETKRKGQP